MAQTIKTGLTTIIFFNILSPLAAAANTDTVTGISPQIVFALTIIIGIIIGFILVHVSAENRQAKGKIITSKLNPGEIDPDEIFQELKDLSGSAKNQKKVAVAISSLLEEKVEQKVTVVKQELTEKYGKLVDEKSKQAIEAQKKFKKTLNEKKQTEAIVRSVAAGVVVVNNKGEVLLMNPAAEKL